MGMARQLELRAVDAPRFEGLDLAGEMSRVDDDTIGDDRDHVVVEDTRRYELQREPLTIDDDGVPSVVTALVTHDEVVLLGELIGDLRLPLVSPLGSHDDSYRHVDALYVVDVVADGSPNREDQTSRWSVPSTTCAVMVSPSVALPSRISDAARSPISRWITRFNGRAPNAGS